MNSDLTVSAKNISIWDTLHLNSCIPVGGKHHTDNSNPVLNDRISILGDIHSKAPQLKLK